MKGRYHIRIENKRLQYDLEIRRNITVIRGDSATGKTTLVSMIQSYEDDGPASGVSIVCDKECTVLRGQRWKDVLRTIHDSIVFIDEQNRFMESEDFALEIRNSDNYYVLITRSKLDNLPYSVEEIYGMRVSSKYLGLKKTYNELYRIYENESMQCPVDELLIEDSNSGYQFFKSQVRDGIKCISASGKSNIYTLVKLETLKQKNNEKPVLAIVADGAAFGSEMEKLHLLALRGYRIVLYLPESFEWLILQSGLITGHEIQNILDDPSQYIESRIYFSWERFFTAILIEKTRKTYLEYTKSKLNNAYIQPVSADKIKAVLPEQLKDIFIRER